MMLLAICHLLLNIGPIITFITDFLFSELINSGFAASTNMFLILVNILYRSAILFIISSYLGRLNSSACSTCNTPSTDLTITMPNEDEPKPGSMPIDCCAYLLGVLYFLPDSTAVCAVWNVLPIRPRYCKSYSLLNERDFFAFSISALV